MLAQQLWGLLQTFAWLVHYVQCPNVSTINFNLLSLGLYIKYLPLSYPLRTPKISVRKLNIGFEMNFSSISMRKSLP